MTRIIHARHKRFEKDCTIHGFVSTQWEQITHRYGYAETIVVHGVVAVCEIDSELHSVALSDLVVKEVL